MEPVSPVVALSGWPRRKAEPTPFDLMAGFKLPAR
jgi:hypothetical protein